MSGEEIHEQVKTLKRDLEDALRQIKDLELENSILKVALAEVEKISVINTASTEDIDE